MTLVCFDLDGTLCNIEHRLGFVRSKPKNWKAFDAGIPNDAVNMPVAQVYWALANNKNNTIIFASGRSDKTRNDTETWLRKHIGSEWQKLYMRKEGDYRSDDIVKNEIIDEILADYGKLPDMWFDDRKRVVKAVRARGIFVFDVYQSEEDF